MMAHPVRRRNTLGGARPVPAVQRALILAGAVVVVAAGALLWWPDADGPDDSVRRVEWHANATYSFTNRFCGDCHYGLTEMWRADWTPVEEANVTVAWDLAVSPQWPDADLYAVQVSLNEGALVLWESGERRQEVLLGETWSWTFDVPDGASAIFARLHGQGPEAPADCRIVAACPNDYETALALIDPDGQRTASEGPETDLRLLTVMDPAPGVWTLEAVLEAGESPRAQAVAFVDVLGGNVTPHLHGTDQVVHRLPAGPTGAPPSAWLRLQPHHDHRLYENIDWDLYDSSPFVVAFEARPGPAPGPRVWSAEEIEEVWNGQSAKVFLEREGSLAVAYVDEPGHNDPGVGGSYPGFGPLGNPVPHGAARVEFELTWSPPTAEPNFGIRFSPAGTPYFFDAVAVGREPGRALFETTVEPEWWEEPDQVLAWLDPDRVTGYWDVAPRLVEEPGAARAAVLDWHLTATAVR